jgi:hypothetical protein
MLPKISTNLYYIRYMYLVISTLPHFCSILPLVKYYKTHTFEYINIIFLSTLSSILYHTYEESNTTITHMDYICSGLWFIYDIHMGYTYTHTKILYKIILLNTISFIINIQIPYNLYYPLNHSLWHLINAYKCYHVSNYIKIGLRPTNISNRH